MSWTRRNYKIVDAILRVQFTPSPTNPSIQAQVTLPCVLVQLECGLQPPLFTSHKSVSQRTATCIVYRVGQKTGPFLNVDNFTMVTGRKACDMSKFYKICLEKSTKSINLHSSVF